jgi:sulfur transfer protein SufE
MVCLLVSCLILLLLHPPCLVGFKPSVPFTHRSRSHALYGHDGHVTSAFDTLFQLSDSIAPPTLTPNTTAVLLRLIALGDSWKQPEPELLSQFEKVRGCMADTRIRSSIDHNGCLYVSGYADSRVAQGMLALLAIGLQGVAITQVAEIDIDGITSKCTVSSLLPQGRYNGFIGMLKLIKEQCSKLVSGHTLPIQQPPLHYTEEVAMLLSGGVDSSVALQLLVNQGITVRAFYLKIWLEDEIAYLNTCPWEEDLHYATQICNQLNIPLETVSLQKEYWDKVVQYTFQESKLGRTPNPDVMCNSQIKFGVFLNYFGNYFKKIATGHYAQVVENKDKGGVYELICSSDNIKDQTYFLSNLQQSQLSKCIFPIGHLQKSQVRILAEQFNLPTKNRKDSQGICFLGKLKFDEFIVHYLGT